MKYQELELISFVQINARGNWMKKWARSMQTYPHYWKVNLNQGKIKLVQVKWEFGLTKVWLADGKWMEKWGQI